MGFWIFYIISAVVAYILFRRDNNEVSWAHVWFVIIPGANTIAAFILIIGLVLDFLQEPYTRFINSKWVDSFPRKFFGHDKSNV